MPKGKIQMQSRGCSFCRRNSQLKPSECQWRKRKSNSSLSLLAVEELFPLPKNYVPITRSPNIADRHALYASLKAYGRFTGLCGLMSPEPAPQAKLPVPIIEEIVYSEEFVLTRGTQQQLVCLVRKPIS